jgi:hypothetical protein
MNLKDSPAWATLDDEFLDCANGGVVRSVLAGELHDFHAPTTYGASYGHLPTASMLTPHVDPHVEVPRAGSVGTPVLTAASLAQHDAALMSQFDQLLRQRLAATSATAAQAAQPNPMQQMMSMLPNLLKGAMSPSGGGGSASRGGSPSGGQQGSSSGQSQSGQNGQDGNGEREQDSERMTGDTQRGGDLQEPAPAGGNDGAFGNGNTAYAGNDPWTNGTSAVPYTNAYTDAGFNNGGYPTGSFDNNGVSGATTNNSFAANDGMMAPDQQMAGLQNNDMGSFDGSGFDGGDSFA